MKIYRPSADEVDAAAAQLIAKRPAEAARYGRATSIVIAGSIQHNEHMGWTVASQDRKTNGELYAVSAVSCECYDFRQHHMACKHIAALAIYGRVLAAKLNALMPALPEDLYFQVLRETGSEAIAADAADAASIDPILGDDTIFIVPGTQSNVRHLFDRVSGADICSAQQQPSGCWRPLEAADTLDWARWLGAQQGENEGAVVVAQPEPEPRTLAADPDPEPETWIDAAAQMHALLDAPPSSIPVSRWAQSPYKAHQRNAYKYAQR